MAASAGALGARGWPWTVERDGEAIGAGGVGLRTPSSNEGTGYEAGVGSDHEAVVGATLGAGAEALGSAIAVGAHALGSAVGVGAQALGSAVGVGALAPGSAVGVGAQALGSAVGVGAEAAGLGNVGATFRSTEEAALGCTAASWEANAFLPGSTSEVAELGRPDAGFGSVPDAMLGEASCRVMGVTVAALRFIGRTVGDGCPALDP